MSAGISLVTLNIERSKHADRVAPFLKGSSADVVCLQELMEYDIPFFEASVGARCYFTGTTRHPAEGKPGIFGIGIFSKLPVAHFERRFYHDTGIPKMTFDFTDAASKHRTESHALALCDVEKDGVMCRIATTHFTWTPDGRADDFQRQDLKVLLEALEGEELVLTGDFNAPRGGEIWSALAARYTDNIPPRIITTIDGGLHRAGDLQLVVDGIFSTPAYRISDVALKDGLSDHMAVCATAEKLSHS